MRTIKYTHHFKRDYKREKKSVNHKKLESELFTSIKLLAEDKPLPQNKYDHALIGNWNDHRNCHIRPDLILIYRKLNANILELVRLGSHSKLSI